MNKIFKKIAARWLDKNYCFRHASIELVSESSGLSREMVALGIDIIFRRIIAGDFPLPAYTESLKGNVFAIIGGIIPAVTVEVVLACLARKRPLILKPPSIEPHFGMIFIESVIHEYPELSVVLRCLPVSSHDHEAVTKAVDLCDTVVAYGGDSTIEILRQVSSGKNFIPNGNMASFGFIDSLALTEKRFDETATVAAYDTAMYDQQGCLSPHVYFVESDYETASAFAEKLYEKLDSLENRLPIGKISADRQFLLRRFVEEWRLKKLAGKGIRIFSKEKQLCPAVILDPSPESHLSPNFRVIFVKPVDSIAEMLRSLARFQRKIKGISTTSSYKGLKEAIKTHLFIPPEIITGHGRLQFYL